MRVWLTCTNKQVSFPILFPEFEIKIPCSKFFRFNPNNLSLPDLNIWWGGMVAVLLALFQAFLKETKPVDDDTGRYNPITSMNGTLVNTLAVIVGSGIGLLLHKRFPEKIRQISFQGIGLCTVVIGLQMAFTIEGPEDMLMIIFSILIGGITGEAINIEYYFNRLGELVKKRIGSSNERFTEGLITAFLLFCVGSLTILGALEEGLRGDPSLLYTKSVLDGFGSAFLSSVYGVGVLVSAVPLFIYQGSLTWMASFLQDYVSDFVLDQVSATGGVMILGLGINLLEIKQIKISNLLPALLVVVIVSLVYESLLA